MKRGVAVIAGFVALALASSAAWAGYSQGGAFRHPGFGARAWGMGGAAVATVDDESAVYWNPAMMGMTAGDAIGASYIDLVPGATARQSQLAYVRVLQRSRRGPDGTTPVRQAIGAMYTNLHLELSGGEGYSENVLRVAYALSPDYFITFGAALNILTSTSDVDNFDALGSSVDFAMRLSLTERLVVGAVARNAFSRYSYDDGRDYEGERAVTVGASYRYRDLGTAETDLVFEHGDLSRFIVGAESRYLFDRLALRAGFASINTGDGRAVPYFGFGARVLRDRLTVHYNANLDEEKALENTHRFSLSVSL